MIWHIVSHRCSKHAYFSHLVSDFPAHRKTLDSPSWAWIADSYGR